jgi:hypothetical protein
VTKDKPRLILEILDEMAVSRRETVTLFMAEMEGIVKKTGKVLNDQPLEVVEAIHKKYVKRT